MIHKTRSSGESIHFFLSTSGGSNILESHSASSGNYTVSGHREKVTNLTWVSTSGNVLKYFDSFERQ